MKYLIEHELIWSPVVANCKMNRSRKATGVNSYEREFRFHIGQWLTEMIKQNGNAAWLDLCCGEANALIETEQYLVQTGNRDKALLMGIDMVLQHSIHKGSTIRLLETTLQEWEVTGSFDLITCSHGLHYVGDKLQTIIKACSALKPNGRFSAHLDMSHVRIRNSESPERYLKSWFKSNGFSYGSRSKILTAYSPVKINPALIYIGADDKAGPNYTGQEAVASYYDIF